MSTRQGKSLRLEMLQKTWELSEPLAISRGELSITPSLQLRLVDVDGFVGRGEAAGVSYAGETPDSMMATLEAVRSTIEAGINRYELLTLLPPGGARFAVDSALWDLEAKRGDGNPFMKTGLQPNPIVSDRTIGIGSSVQYENAARSFADHPILKIKVDARDPVAAVGAVRRGAPRSKLIVDPNEAWSVADLKTLAPRLAAAGVVLLEQPIPVGSEDGLDGYDPPIPMCADELVNDANDLAKVFGRFQFVNIKLDKTGGLTSALKLADAAEKFGLGLMVGCMSGSSLCIAPAMVIAQRSTFIDLDSPLLLKEDIKDGFIYDAGAVSHPHRPSLWG